MSSSGKTYFVVYYDHDDMGFYLDSGMSGEKFPRDTWDSVEEQWVHLDWNMDMVESVESLTEELEEKLNG